MGQILVIQDQGEISAALSAEHSVVQATGVQEAQRTLGQHSFQAAVAIAKDAADAQALLAAILQADADLSVVLIAPDDSHAAGSGERAWEVIPRSSPEAVRSAVLRASRHTALLRENRVLRSQHGSGDAQDGNGAKGMPLQWIASLPPRFDLRELLSSVEKGVIQRTLEATRGAQAEAARRLGLSRSDLSYKLAKYELRKPAAVRSN